MKSNRVVIGVVVLTLTPASGSSQPPAISSLDSAAVIERIRQIQRQFERTRWEYLPIKRASYAPCDASIGRWCYWLSMRGRNPDRVVHPTVTAARDTLLARLDSAHAVLPHSGWITGLRVRYRTEQGDWDAATAAATACGPRQRWWCAALRGYVAHVAGDFRAAEFAFDTALGQMDEAQRCEWTDLGPVLSGATRSAYRRLGCPERGPVHHHVLWLADPLYATDGNELRTEHLSRFVWSALIRDAPDPAGRWSSARHRGIVRYGRPYAWFRDRPAPGMVGGPRIITHHDVRSRFFFPVRLPDPIADADSDTWRLAPDPPRSWHVAGAGLTVTETLPHRLLRFPRGDHYQAVVAVELFADTAFAPDAAHVYAFFRRSPSDPAATSRQTLVGGHAVLMSTVPNTPQLVSIEAVDTASQHARRARYGIPPIGPTPTGVQVSDLMVLPPGDELPTRLGDAAPRLQVSHAFLPGQSADLYWEVISPSNDPMTMTASLQVQRSNRSVLRRLLERTPLARSQTAVDLRWVESVRPTDGVFRRALSVTLPADLDPGRYRVTLRLTGRDGYALNRTAQIEVTR